MGKTIRGGKGSGYEYWSREANGEGKWLTKPGKFTKKKTHKKERSSLKKQLRDSIQKI